MSYVSERYTAPLCPNAGLSLLQYGWQKCGPGHVQGPLVYRHDSITFLLRGKGTFTTGGRQYPLSGGQGFMIFPGCSFQCRADGADPWEYVFFVFQGNDAQALAESAGLTPESPVFRFDDSSAVTAGYEAMCAIGTDESAAGYDLLSVFLGIMSPLVSARTRTRPAESEAPVRKALAFMKANYPYGITVSDAAAFVGLERSWFYRLFLQETGCSPGAWLTAYRLEQGARMLETGTFSVTETANSVGFYDAAHFSRAFRKHYGISPSRWRTEKLQG